jgi:zinc protease
MNSKKAMERWTTRTPEPTRVQVEYKQFVLENGLKVILRKDSCVPVVAVDVCYHVGSKNEKKGKTGFAHLFEHLMFEGSENVKKGEFDKYISLAGGYNNAYTTEDVTNYYDVIPSNQLPLALWLESDRMLKFCITEEALLTQREVVKEEKRWRIDNRPYGDVAERIQGLIFPASQYHWPVIGSMDDLDSATMDDVREFYENYYRPNNAVLVVSGDIDFEEAEYLVRKYFSDIPPGKMDSQVSWLEEQPIDEEIVETMEGNVPSSAVFVAYRIPQDGSAEFYALKQLGRVLSDGDSSRLYKRLMYETQAVSDFDVSVEGMEKAGVFLFSAFVSPGHSEKEVLSIFDEEIDKLQTSPVSDYEHRKAQNSALSDYVGRLSVNSGVADLLAHYQTFFNDAGIINSEIDRKLSVTPESMMEVSQRFLKNNQRMTLLYYPRNH